MKKIIITITIILFIGVSVYMLSKYYIDSSNKEATSLDFIMGTVVTQNIYGIDGEDSILEIKKCIMDLEEDTISWRKLGSEIYGINNHAQANEEYPIGERLYTYLYKTKELAQYSNGALEPTIRPLVELWGIEGDSPKVPNDEELKDVLKQINYNNIELNDNNSIILVKGTKIDLGAVGKGIACDEVLAILENNNDVDGAVIAIGGSILTYGNKPEGNLWQVAIRDPNGDENSILGVISLSGTNFVSTSGVYEKYFTQNDIRYHHILDSKTGYPSDTGLLSVTIVCDDGLYSDGLSTACIVLGMEKSKELLEKYNAEAIFVTEDNEVYVTNGLKSIFTIKTSGYEVKE